jgi:chromosome segregation ATPase
MNSPDTTAGRSSTELDATDELPALDPAAYEAELASRQATESSGSGVSPAGRDVSGAEPFDNCETDPAPQVLDADLMLEVERWIAQKSDELRAQQTALRVAQRERTADVARADALSRELGATSANLEALNNRTRSLEDELTSERQAALRRAAELDEAQREAARLGHELTAARAGEERQSAALAASAALHQQRSEALEALQSAHAALVADRQRAANELSELQSRLQDSEARERKAQRTIEAQNRSHAELMHRTQDETRVRERLAAEREPLQAQLASCVERLQTREAYRAMFESTIRELDDELAGATLRAEEQEARGNQLAAELEVRERRLRDAVRERDDARRSHDTAVAQQAIERGASEETRSALESRVAELGTEQAGARARLLAMEATLTDTQRRAEAEAPAKATAAQRLREMEVEIASLEKELANARLEVARGRASLLDLTAALERSQAMLADQSHLLEDRESVAQSMAASHAELVTLIAALRGQIEELTGRLVTPVEERRALVEQVAALTREAAESDSRNVRLESMNVELRATVKRLHASLAERDAELQRATRIASTNAYALGRVQSGINEMSRGLTDSEAVPGESQVSILTRIDHGKNHSFVLRARTTVGRNPDNDLSLTMGSVSRHHAVVIPAFRSALLQDLGSTNGVLVNKRRVRCARLEHGDVITLGEAQFRYTVAPVPAGAVSERQTSPRRRAHR